MATVVPQDTRFQQGVQILQTGIGQLSKSKLDKKKLALAEKTAETSKAYQEALGEQASSTAEKTRAETATFNSLSPKVRQDLLRAKYGEMKQTNSAQAAEIQNLIRLQQLTEAQGNAESLKIKNISEAFIKQTEAEGVEKEQAFLHENQKLANALQTSNLELKKREANDAEFDKVAEGLSPTGQVAAYKAWKGGKSVIEAGEIGLAAEQTTKVKTEDIKRGKEIAAKRQSQRPPSPQDINVIKKTYGHESYSRSTAARASGKPSMALVSVPNYDRDRGTGFFDKDKGTFNIDYKEALDSNIGPEWLRLYEEQYNEPYDIPSSLAGGTKSVKPPKAANVEGPVDDEGNPPPESIVKQAQEKYPDKTLVYKDGKWGVE